MSSLKSFACAFPPGQRLEMLHPQQFTKLAVLHGACALSQKSSTSVCLNKDAAVSVSSPAQKKKKNLLKLIEKKKVKRLPTRYYITDKSYICCNFPSKRIVIRLQSMSHISGKLYFTFYLMVLHSLCASACQISKWSVWLTMRDTLGLAWRCQVWKGSKP